MFALSSHGNFRIRKNLLSNLVKITSSLFHFHYCSQANRFNLRGCLDCSVEQLLLKCLRFSEKRFTCENCGSQTTRNNFVGHKKRCSAGTLYCTQCPNFSTTSQDDSNYHIAKKHSSPNLSLLSSVKFVIRFFQDFTLYVNIKTPNMAFLSTQQSCSGQNHQRS